MTPDHLSSLSELVEACPFCGSIAAIDEFNGREPFEFRYICENKECQAWGPEKPTREEAQEAWNRRTQDPQLLARITALEAEREGSDGLRMRNLRRA